MFQGESFESSVNPEGIQTIFTVSVFVFTFESSVNPEGIQTVKLTFANPCKFESSVNPEGIQTDASYGRSGRCLRVV